MKKDTLLLKELWSLVFSFLDAKNRSRAAQVCTLWKSIADDATFWKEACQAMKLKVREDENPKVVFIKAYREEMLRIKNLDRVELLNELLDKGKMTTAQCMIFSSPAFSGH